MLRAEMRVKKVVEMNICLIVATCLNVSYMTRYDFDEDSAFHQRMIIRASETTII